MGLFACHSIPRHRNINYGNSTCVSKALGHGARHDHFHHFVNKVFERQFNFSTRANNSLSSLAILVGQLGCMLFALRFKHHSLACFLVFCFLTIVCLSSCLYSIRKHEGQQS